MLRLFFINCFTLLIKKNKIMKKIFSIIVLLLLSIKSFSQKKGNYILIINNDSIEVNLNSEINYKTSKKEKLSIKVIQPNILTYSDEMISFDYRKSLSVSNTNIDDDIEQCMVIESTGNGFMIQKYKTFDPSSLTRLMLNEITKESISYGYSKTEEKFEKKLLSGQTIRGIKATLTYKGEKEIYTVATYGAKDEGIVVITMNLDEEFTSNKNMIDLFLETLSLK